MALPIIGLVITGLVQADACAKRLRTRFKHDRENHEKVNSIHKMFSSSITLLTRCEQALKDVSVPLSPNMEEARKDRVTALKQLADSIFNDMDALEKKYFPSSVPPPNGDEQKGGWLTQQVENLVRWGRANKIHSILCKVEKTSEKLEDKLGHLRRELSLEEKIDARPRTSTTADEFSSPALTVENPERTVLDFDSSDTLEGELKAKVLEAGDSGTVAAVGARTHGVVGMGGVGKTVAMTGLATQDDIKARFEGGIYFMSFGQQATRDKVLEEIKNIVEESGGVQCAKRVSSAKSAAEGAAIAAKWFYGKICLFLCDDLWSTEADTGFFHDLRILVSCHPKSRMVITTRDSIIANEAGSEVIFTTRDATGTVSKAMFLRHAGIADEVDNAEFQEHLQELLELCGGLPLMLAVVGRRLAVERSNDNICARFRKRKRELEDERKKMKLLEGPVPNNYPTSLKAAVVLSVKFLGTHLLNNAPGGYTVEQMFQSLSILRNQGWIPVSVLSRLWKMDATDYVEGFNRLGLVTNENRKWKRYRSGEESEEDVVMLHDLTLDICRVEARLHPPSSDTGDVTSWDEILLNTYFEADHSVSGQTAIRAQTLQGCPYFNVGEQHRRWWSEDIPEDGYIHANLSRHLSCAGLGIELADLLLDARWTVLRQRIGGILALQTDFQELETFFVQLGSSGENESIIESIAQSLKQIFKAVRLSWGRMADGLRAFQLQLCGRLLSLQQSNPLVGVYLKSVEMCTPKPFLKPVSAFFPNLSSAQIMEIPIGGQCDCIVCSPCGRYIAAAAGNDIVVAKSCTGELLQRMKGHTARVNCVSFAEDSKKIFSGSWDGMIIEWEWEASESPVQVLQGHSGSVSGIAAIGNGQSIFSCSADETLRSWDVTVGIQTYERLQSSWVSSISICEKLQKVALGLDNGTLRILDSVTKEVVFEDSTAHQRCIASVSFSPNALHLATGSWDKTIRIWNTSNWTRAGQSFEGHKDFVSSISFSPDGKCLASSSYDCTLRLWDVESGNDMGISPKMTKSVESICFTADGERILSGSRDEIIRVWDVRLGTNSEYRSRGHTDRVQGVSISADGLRVASASRDGTIRLWNAITGEQIGPAMEGHTDAVPCVSFSPDGRQLVSGSADRTLRLWNTDTCMQIGVPFEGHMDIIWCAAFSSDGFRIISGSSDCTVRLWNIETKEKVGLVLEGYSKPVYCASESSDGRYIVVMYASKRTFIWNLVQKAVIWKSEILETDFENKILDIEAAKIIRSCGQQTPHLWPNAFPAYSAELYCDEDYVKSNILPHDTVLGIMQSYGLSHGRWTYHSQMKVFAAGLRNGLVAVCNLITE